MTNCPVLTIGIHFENLFGGADLRKALVAVNIRDLFKNPPGENFGFLAGGVEVTLPDEAKEFWDAARRFNIKMAKLRSSPKRLMEGVAALNLVEPTLMDAVYFAAYGDFRNKTALSAKGLVLTKTGEPRRSLDVTYIGLVSLDKDTNLETIFFVPMLSSNYEKTIGIVTAGGEMNIVMLHDVSQFSSASMEDFKQKITRNIKEVSLTANSDVFGTPKTWHPTPWHVWCASSFQRVVLAPHVPTPDTMILLGNKSTIPYSIG